jgi:deoxyribonuclease-4
MSLVGIHIDDINNIDTFLSDGHKKSYKNLGLVQAFASATSDYTSKKFSHIKKTLQEHNLTLVIHASYSINLANRWRDTDWWIQQFINEIKGAHDLGAFAIVVHTGKQLELTPAEAINNMYTSLLHVHQKTNKMQDVKILIETPSGQGTEMLTRIEDMCRFMKKFYTHPDFEIQDRFGLCIDTCHVFASGYDVRTDADQNILFGIIDRSIGISKIKLCHINDSKKGLGDKVDRHENIGEGEIGEDGIIKIVKFMKNLEIPMILETPQRGVDRDYKLLIQSK